MDSNANNIDGNAKSSQSLHHWHFIPHDGNSGKDIGHEPEVGNELCGAALAAGEYADVTSTTEYFARHRSRKC